MMYNRFLGNYPAAICGGLGGLGLLVYVAGVAEAGKGVSAESALACLGTPKHWGLLVMLSACLVYAHCTYRRIQANRPAAAPPQVQKAPAAPPPVKFPPLHLQSIVFQGARSSALINGKVVCLGEDVELVQVVEIRPDRVFVAFQGQTNMLALGEAAR